MSLNVCVCVCAFAFIYLHIYLIVYAFTQERGGGIFQRYSCAQRHGESIYYTVRTHTYYYSYIFPAVFVILRLHYFRNVLHETGSLAKSKTNEPKHTCIYNLIESLEATAKWWGSLLYFLLAGVNRYSSLLYVLCFPLFCFLCHWRKKALPDYSALSVLRWPLTWSECIPICATFKDLQPVVSSTDLFALIIYLGKAIKAFWKMLYTIEYCFV